MTTCVCTCKYAILLLLALGLRTASADTGIAYAMVGVRNPPVETSYSLNPSGGSITSVHLATGQYTVTFPNSGIGSGWSVLATGYGNDDTNYCNVAGWDSNVVSVNCFNPFGGPSDTDNFTVLAISNQNDKQIAYTFANLPTTASYTPAAAYSYNPGGTTTVSRSGKGVYSVFFNGLNGSGGTVQINAYGSSANCNSAGWGGSLQAIVKCYDPAGNPVDSKFVIAVVPAGVSPTGLAYSLANQDSAASYTPAVSSTYNPTGKPVGIVRKSIGQYEVTFAGLNAAHVPGGNLRVTANVSTARCKVGWTFNEASSLIAKVYCFDIAGNPVDAEYQVLALPPVGYAYALISGTADVLTGYWVNPGGTAPTADHIATGNYTVNFPNSGIGAGWVAQAIAYGTNASICKINFWTGNAVSVICFNSAGTAVDASFTVLAISNTNGNNIAFARADQAATSSYSPDAFSAYNPGGAITITRASPGTYAVVFHGLNGNGGTVQVSAFGPGTATCYSNGWDSPDFEADVSCETPSGAAVDSRFVITVISAHWYPFSSAYAWANLPTTTSYTANTSYAYPTSVVNITRHSTGSYGLTFVGLGNGLFNGGNARVTPYSTVNRCKVVSWSGSVDVTVEVNCFNTSGAFSDAEFQVLVFPPINSPLSIVHVNGASSQSTVATTPFGTALGAWVIDSSTNPVEDVPVTFTAPSSGASGTFPGSVLSVQAYTNASGVATAPTFTANGTTGLYTVTASVLGIAAPANFSLTNTPLTSVTLQTSPAGLNVSLDGGGFVPAPIDAELVPDSSHTIATQSPQAGAAGVQYVWQNWSDTGNISHSIVVPGLSTIYTANFKTQYQLTIVASPVAGGSVTPASGTFFDSATVVPITATANAGFTFGGWSGPVVNSSSASTTVTMNATATVTANFLPFTNVTIQTNPAGLQFSVDGGAAQTAPQTISLSQMSHNIAVATTQATTPGTQYVFTQWNDNVAASRSIVVNGSPATYTATFKTQYQLTLAASPAEGGSVTPATGTFFDSSTVVPIAVTANAGFTFGGWSGPVANSSSASTTVAMGAPATITANFLSFTNVTIQTSPAGLQFSVDGGTVQTAPQTIALSQTSHTIAVVTTQAGTPGTQYLFTGWNDTGAPSHSIVVNGSPTTYAATFKTQYQLTLAASPGAGGSVTPASGTFLDSATVAPITATANPGFTFGGWSGPVANSASASTTVTMGGPATLAANFAAIVINPCDVKLHGGPDISDVQAMINQAHGLTAGVNDLDQNGRVDVTDVQLVINSALGLGCHATSM